MRRLLLPLLVLIPFAAFAQDEDDRIVDEDEGGEIERGGDEIGFGGRGGRGEAAEGGDTPPTAPESYTVQRGDTLWNLSQRFLNNPWYWPKIWSYNPQLDNPNWIRPGTVLRFYPGEAPVEVRREEEEEIEPDFEDLGEGGGFEDRTNIAATNEVGTDVRRREFFIPADRLDDAGLIQNSPEEKQFLADDDRTYIKLKKQARPGDVLQVFRKERDLRHPVTGANLGTIVVMTGEVRIDQEGREQSLGTVVSTWDPVERGQYVGALPVATEPVRRVENTKNVKGYVVDAAPSPLSFMAESYIAVIDKGSADGVREGNTFTIVRAGDPYTREYTGMSDEDIGELIVVETFKSSSTALLTAASRVVVPGDRIEMRTR
jgi:hypothetical protein